MAQGMKSHAIGFILAILQSGFLARRLKPFLDFLDHPLRFTALKEVLFDRDVLELMHGDCASLSVERNYTRSSVPAFRDDEAIRGNLPRFAVNIEPLRIWFEIDMLSLKSPQFAQPESGIQIKQHDRSEIRLPPCESFFDQLCFFLIVEDATRPTTHSPRLVFGDEVLCLVTAEFDYFDNDCWKKLKPYPIQRVLQNYSIFADLVVLEPASGLNPTFLCAPSS